MSDFYPFGADLNPSHDCSPAEEVATYQDSAKEIVEGIRFCVWVQEFGMDYNEGDLELCFFEDDLYVTHFSFIGMLEKASFWSDQVGKRYPADISALERMRDACQQRIDKINDLPDPEWVKTEQTG